MSGDGFSDIRAAIDSRPLVSRDPDEYGLKLVEIDWKFRAFHDCEHGPYLIDEKLRRVVCERCHEILDPFDVLLNYRRWWRNLDNKIDRIAEFERKESERAEKRRARYEKKRLACARPAVLEAGPAKEGEE